MTSTTFKIGDHVRLTEVAQQRPRIAARVIDEPLVVDAVKDVPSDDQAAAGHHQRLQVRGTVSTGWVSDWMTAAHFRPADPPAARRK